ncbi:MFS transporter [Rhodoplanes sp. Z2-YC6860]|uniref:MFS transporter n=1 Tax=Rhodoplanes sp. Z2-YC6860 TaxID=674703 RepID=UPI0018DE0856|nr:MFS transporter [Rhodoplanes sp. Z2-YC6860]
MPHVEKLLTGVGAARPVPYKNALASFIAADTLFGCAEDIIVVATGWLIFSKTKSTFALGMIGLAGFMPLILFSLLTGIATDRFDRRSVLALSGAAFSIGALALCFAANLDAVWPIYLIVVFISSGKAFLSPVSKALLPNLVPQGGLTRGVALTNSFGGTARLLAPAIGGLLYMAGPTVPFLAAAVIGAAGVLFCIGIGPRPAARIDTTTNTKWSTLIAGFVFIWSSPIVLAAMTLDLVAVLLAGVSALMPYYAQEIFQAGPWALGIMRTAPAVGGILTSSVLAYWPLQRRAGPTLLVVVAIYGLATIGFGLSTNFYVALFFLAMLGASDSVSMLVRQTLVQAQTPDAMRGRVSAVHTLLAGSSGELGEVESGLLSAVIGVVPCVVVGGVAAVIAAAAWAVLVPALRRADRFERGPAAP